jgi:glycosyltransferase involved in cell wall biosynthesis
MLTRAVFPLHGNGGLERHVHDCVRHLSRRGVRVTVITQPPTVGVASSVAAPGDGHGHVSERFVSYRTFPFAGRRGTTVLDRSTAYPVFGWRAGRLAARLVREGGIQLVHGHGASVLGYALARRRDRLGTVPLVLNPHGLEEFGGTNQAAARFKRMAYRPLQEAVRACGRAADRVIATDRVLLPGVLRNLQLAPELVVVVPNAVDLETVDTKVDGEARRALRASLDLGETDSLLLSVGRIEENKGFQVLVEALARLASDAESTARSKWHWALVGDGPNRPRLEQAVRMARLTDRVTFAGRVGEGALHAWYEAASILVHPTLYEGSSIVTLEAMAHRRPVIASRAGGLPDKVKPGVNGWLVEPGDADLLANAIREALSASNRLAGMGDAGRALVEREFSWTTATDRLLAVYGDVLAGGS